MRKINAFESITLDGVMQAPAHADEDRRGGFEHGGWAMPYADPEVDAGRAADAGMAGTGAVLLGRVTYEDFASVWPGQPDNPFGRFLNAARKYVASRTLREPLEWQNSQLLEGDAIDAIARLRDSDGPDVIVLGSGQIVRQLLARNLLDELTLQIHPVVLGDGIRLLEGGQVTKLRLADSSTTAKGVVIATYHPA
jgi:dihydrofolate reductase